MGLFDKLAKLIGGAAPTSAPATATGSAPQRATSGFTVTITGPAGPSFGSLALGASGRHRFERPEASSSLWQQRGP